MILKWRSSHSIPTLSMAAIDRGAGRNRDWDGICDGDRNGSRDGIWHPHSHAHAHAYAEVDGHTHSHSHSAVDHWIVVDHGMEV